MSRIRATFPGFVDAARTLQPAARRCSTRSSQTPRLAPAPERKFPMKSSSGFGVPAITAARVTNRLASSGSTRSGSGEAATRRLGSRSLAPEIPNAKDVADQAHAVDGHAQNAVGEHPGGQGLLDARRRRSEVARRHRDEQGQCREAEESVFGDAGASTRCGPRPTMPYSNRGSGVPFPGPPRAPDSPPRFSNPPGPGCRDRWCWMLRSGSRCLRRSAPPAAARPRKTQSAGRPRRRRRASIGSVDPGSR